MRPSVTTCTCTAAGACGSSAGSTRLGSADYYWSSSHVHTQSESVSLEWLTHADRGPTMSAMSAMSAMSVRRPGDPQLLVAAEVTRLEHLLAIRKLDSQYFGIDR
jgi:hypothetical protein